MQGAHLGFETEGKFYSQCFKTRQMSSKFYFETGDKSLWWYWNLPRHLLPRVCVCWPAGGAAVRWCSRTVTEAASGSGRRRPRRARPTAWSPGTARPTCAIQNIGSGYNWVQCMCRTYVLIHIAFIRSDQLFQNMHSSQESVQRVYLLTLSCVTSVTLFLLGEVAPSGEPRWNSSCTSIVRVASFS